MVKSSYSMIHQLLCVRVIYLLSIIYLTVYGSRPSATQVVAAYYLTPKSEHLAVHRTQTVIFVLVQFEFCKLQWLLVRLQLVNRKYLIDVNQMVLAIRMFVSF